MHNAQCIMHNLYQQCDKTTKKKCIIHNCHPADARFFIMNYALSIRFLVLELEFDRH